MLGRLHAAICAPPATCSHSVSRWCASALEIVSVVSTGISMGWPTGRSARGVAMTTCRIGASTIADGLSVSQVGGACRDGGE